MHNTESAIPQKPFEINKFNDLRGKPNSCIVSVIMPYDDTGFWSDLEIEGFGTSSRIAALDLVYTLQRMQIDLARAEAQVKKDFKL